MERTMERKSGITIVYYSREKYQETTEYNLGGEILKIKEIHHLREWACFIFYV